MQIKEEDVIITQEVEQLKDILMYFKNPLGLHFTKCEAKNFTIIINERGEMDILNIDME